jgi:nitrogen regulatory protein PII
MRPCKRLEIVIERSQAHRVEHLLKEVGASGYTVIQNAGGGGDRGYRRADDVTDADENCVFIVAVERDTLVAAIVDGVRPMLQRFGGVCLVSDANWVIH